MENAINKIWTLAKEIAAFAKQSKMPQTWEYLDADKLINVYNADDYLYQSVQFDQHEYKIECALYSGKITIINTMTAENINQIYDNSKNAFDKYVDDYFKRTAAEIDAERIERIARLENELLTLKNA